MTDCVATCLCSDRSHHHFYGYFNIDPWDSLGRYHLSLRTTWHDAPPLRSQEADVGVVDAERGLFLPLGRTAAFNFQQGSMLHWIDRGRGLPELTYNDWHEGAIVTRIVNLQGEITGTLGKGLAGLHPSGSYALGLDFARMYHCRSVVGYANNNQYDDFAPVDDGIHVLDLNSGSSRVLLSIRELTRHAEAAGPTSDYWWFNHLLFDPSGERIVFIARRKSACGFIDSFWMVRSDGSGLTCLIPPGNRVSHFDWIDGTEILVSTSYGDGRLSFKRLNVDTGLIVDCNIPALPEDGHACFSPDGRWLVCDRYPDPTTNIIVLLLYDVRTGRTRSLGEYLSPTPYRGDIRCDLHPRWNRHSSLITIDSIHEGDRQIYQIDIGSLRGSFARDGG